MTGPGGGLAVTFLLPCHSRKPIGGARVVYQYANGLASRGHSVTVVHAAVMERWQYRRPLSWREPRVLARGLLDLARGARGETAAPGWQCVDPRVRLLYTSTLAPRRVPDADAVVATSWRTAESLARYPAAKGVGHYLIQHYEVWDGPKQRVDATWKAPLRKVVIAQWLIDVGRSLGLDDMVRIPNGLDHSRFRLSRGIADRGPRVAMLSSPARLKGTAEGVAALVRARRAVPRLEAVLFGVRPRPTGLPDWVEYHQNPAQDVLAEVYNRSSIYLCPSHGEGWHLPPAEAMACGCAVVSTDIGGVRDYALPGETALLAPVGDSAALADAVVSLCRDDALRVALADAGNRRIRTFTWDRAVTSFEERLLGPAGVAA
ncbi:MAG TPA: glycosyltransferase family 4 protein [Acidimicrobiales bacterium]|nr:glycosyltransferase family 4 protein [Acidimicrobiales bacterium]